MLSEDANTLFALVCGIADTMFIRIFRLLLSRHHVKGNDISNMHARYRQTSVSFKAVYVEANVVLSETKPIVAITLLETKDMTISQAPELQTFGSPCRFRYT